MVSKEMSDNGAELAMERVAASLADRVADRVVKALMDANFDKRFADALLRAIRKQHEEMEMRKSDTEAVSNDLARLLATVQGMPIEKLKLIAEFADFLVKLQKD